MTEKKFRIFGFDQAGEGSQAQTDPPPALKTLIFAKSDHWKKGDGSIFGR